MNYKLERKTIYQPGHKGTAEVHLQSGRIIKDGFIEFNWDAVNESIEKIILDFPDKKLTLKDEFYFMFKEVVQVIVGDRPFSQVSLNVGAFDATIQLPQGFRIMKNGSVQKRYYDLKQFNSHTIHKIVKK